MNVYPFVEAEDAGQDGNVAMTCRLLEVSRAAYYSWSKHIPSERQLSDQALAGRISKIHARSRPCPSEIRNPDRSRSRTMASATGLSVSLRAAWRMVRTRWIS